MPNTPDEHRSRIGLSDLYIAEVTQDNAAGYAADTPAYFAPAAEASLQPAISTVTQYADDLAFDTMTSEGETKINLKVTNIPVETLAQITGRVYDAASGRIWDNPSAVAPYFALMFRSKKSNGSYRYYSYLKGRFEMPKEDAATQGDRPDPKLQEIYFTAVATVYKFDLGSIDDSVKSVRGDEDATNFDGATWFSQVQTPEAVAPSALSLSSSDPTDGASGVALNKTITLTFNNALKDNAIYRVIVTTAAGAIKACTNTLDAAKKVMTVDPDTNLAGSTTYLVTIAVEDVYGQTLETVLDFATV